MSDRPNIVLICADQWRGDCLSIAGHPVVRTPNLDMLGRCGARFSRAYTATPSCIPARAALLTGLSQRTHGRVGYRDGIPWNYDVTLPGEFTKHGYQTLCVGKMHVHPERNLLGFQNVILHDGYIHHTRRRPRDLETADDYLPWLRQRCGHDADYFDNGLNCNAYNVRPWDKDESLHPTNFIVTQSIDFLRRRDTTKPFFLKMSFHRPHPPLDPPQWALDQYVHREMPAPPVGDWANHFAKDHTPWQPDLYAGRLPDDVLHRARAAYYAQMTNIDVQLNRFRETLAEYGVNRNTAICFTSDHGDMMGDHHLWRKSLAYEGSSRVPLLLHVPWDSQIAFNTVRDEVAELRDVMPTLLDVAGLPVPASVEGKSLLPLARGENVPWREYLHGEHTTALGGSQQSCHYVTDGKEKFIWFSGDGYEQLFDLTNDPAETCNLAGKPEHAQRVARWRQRLVDSLAGREEGYTDGGKLVVGRAVNPVLSHVQFS